MKPLRLLLVSHPPLRPEYGAAQLAIELAAALCARGHDASAWSPEPLPPGGHWGGHYKAQRRAIERHLAATGPFDAIDLPALSVSRRVAAASFVVARSIQPDLLYLAASLRSGFSRRPLSPNLAIEAVRATRLAAAFRAGAHRADLVLCLGSVEREWMARRFPRLAPKLVSYVAALGSEDRSALAEVRAHRSIRNPESGIRYLWLGRWVAHKGPRLLLDWSAGLAANDRRDTLTIAGCGEIALEDVARDLLAAGRLRIVERYGRAELPALLAAHDVGLFTSVAEGWGLSLHEMIESGMPIYATPVGGAPDLAAFLPRTIRPFPPPERIAAPDLAIDDLAASGYFEHFSWPRIAEDYERQLSERLSR
ncbi:MAG: glycosyltransferase family 4 protein [Acidobacteriota bacterium]